jgi:predicted dehydrogenase
MGWKRGGVSVKRYNVGIIGYGFIGKVHAYGHLNLPLFYDPVPCQTTITHVCTAHPETAERGRLQIGADYATTDYREITENPRVDIVHICTPNNLHREQLLSAMEHNKHIYCDKPLVVNMEEAGEIERAMQAYHGIAQMTFQNRFFPATIRAKQLVDEDFLGQVLEFRASYLHSGSASPDAPLKWKLSAASGGGVIADLGSHIFDLVHHLLGDLDELLAVTQIAYRERPSAADPRVRALVDAEDAVKILTRMRSGATGVIEASKLSTGTEDELRFEIHGSTGALRFDSMNPHCLEAYDARSADQPAGGRRGWTRIDTGQRYARPAGFPGPKFSIGWMRAHLACLAHFLTNVAEEHADGPGLEQGIWVQKLIERVRTSARVGRWTKV